MNYLTDLIVRPQRNVYNLKDLGDSAFSFSGQDFKRIDFNNGQIKNFKGNKISCSLWCPLESTNRDLATSPLIIYSHGNAGNKIDIIEIFEFLLWEFNICSFDFSGAGFSEGDYVTLGYYEKYDIQAVVEFLRKEFGIKNIILYGRSMGAVSSIRYCEMDPSIKACVLDSPFCNFPRLCEEILLNKLFIPGVMARYLISSARKRLLEKVEGFDIENFIPANNAKKLKVPTLLIHGKSDELVDISHSREIYSNINKNTYKLLLEVEGFHNDTRPTQSVNTIRDFIMQYSYDALILKEHRRRLNIKNAHLNFKVKYSLDINSIVDNFRQTQQNNSRNNSFHFDNSNSNISNHALNHRNFINNKLKLELSKANFDKIQLNEEELQKLKINISNFQTEKTKREPRRLNNFKLDFNILSDNKKTKLFSKKIKSFIKSKSFDFSTSKYKNACFLSTCILNTNNEFCSTNDKLCITKNNENSFELEKRNNSFMHSKNNKFYSMTLFKEEESFLDLLDDDKSNFIDNHESTKINKILDENFDLYEEHLDLLNEFSNKNINKYSSKDYVCSSNLNSNKDNKVNFESELNLARSHSNILNYEDNVFSRNKNYFNIENLNNDYDKNYNKTHVLDDKAKEYFDASIISTQETNNCTDINNERRFVNLSNGRGKLKTRRNQVLSGILNCDVKLGSAQITITDLDRTSLRKGRGSFCNTTIYNGEETINNDKN